MAIRRIRITWLLQNTLPLLLCLVALSWIGYLFGSKMPKYTDELQQIEEAPNYKDYKAFHADLEMNIGQHSNTAKKNLIVVSHGRSGSSLMGDIFNHHPSVFYMYEPLQTVERIYTSLSKIGSDTSYTSLAQQFLNGVLRCKFDQPHVLEDLETYYRKQNHPRVSQAIASPPLCPYKTTDPRWDPSLCPPMTSESLGSACKDNYNLTVIKVILSRVPENSIKNILTACKPLDIHCKVLFLIRDPRAVIASSRSVGFFKENGDDLARKAIRQYSYWRCKETEDNLKFISKVPDSLRKRIKIQRYEDLAFDPLKALSGLYEFAGLPVLESVQTWLNETTKQSRAACNEMDGEQATCTKDDAWVAANRWRWKVHPYDIDIIEFYCGSVMRIMGYKPVERSYELLVNKKVPLFSDNYEAKHWF